MRLNSEIEKKWQKLWREAGAFEPDPDEGRKKFLITVPYPYTNDSLHVGHGRTYTLADVVARFHRIIGENVLFPMAFHQSGTPILAFSKRVASGDSKLITLYREHLQEYEASRERIDEVLESFKEPSGIADYFSEVIINDFTRLGFSIDWRRRFNTAEPIYQNFVTWQFLKLKELGMIKQGDYPVLYSAEDENAVGEDDIKDGDTDKVSIEELTVVLFSGPDYDLAAASLRPETIYGTTNLWISGNGDYVVVNWGGRRTVVAREAYEKIKLQEPSVEIIGEINRASILEARFRVPFSGVEVQAYESPVVDPSFGTGAVFSVPGHSIMDYFAIREAGLPFKPVSIIDMPEGSDSVGSLTSSMDIHGLSESSKLQEATQIIYKAEYYAGRMNSLNGSYSGMTVREARDRIRKDLFESRLGHSVYETSRKAETRGGARVVVAMLKDQWFIDYSLEWLKKATHELVDRMSFFPEIYRKPMHDAIDWLRERPCARKRGLGTRLPFDQEWIIESLSDSTIYMALYTMIAPLRKIHEKIGDVPPEIFDHVVYGMPLSGYDEVDAELREARLSYSYWYGVDTRITAVPHLSNHLAFFLINHAAMFPPDRQPRAIGISGMAVSKGAKIGKSKGNVVSLIGTCNKYSADIYRLFMASSADFSSVIDWNEDDLAALMRKYDQFISILDAYRSEPGDRGSFAARWFNASFKSRIARFIEAMEEYRIRDAVVSIFFEVLNDLKNAESMGAPRNSLLGGIMEQWLTALSCVVPHAAEEYWHRLGNDTFISLNVLDRPGQEEEDRVALESEKYLRKLIEDIREIMSATGKSFSRAEVRVAGAEHTEIARALMNNNRDSVPAEKKRVVGDFMKVRKSVVFHGFNELEVITDGLGIIQNALGIEVTVSESEVDVSGRNPWPGRPLVNLS